MKIILNLAIGLLLPGMAAAQSALPAGTVIPVTLVHGVTARQARADQPIHAKVIQTIPGTELKRGARVVGRVVSATSQPDGTERLEIRFHAVEVSGNEIPLRAALRALASFSEVQDAQIPEEQADSGTPLWFATTRQIGGEQVYRGGGPVASGELIVGKPVSDGVLVKPRSNGRCSGALDGSDTPQAMWLFSSNACGVYGFANLEIAELAEAQPPEAIVLASSRGHLKLPAGTALLLRVGEP
ncbi:MAG: hypothetical protein ACLGSD_13400 [Acidobacteriota bacterium]